VRLAKIRWRIEHDYRELKDGLGLDHFEGRSWIGWHRHVTLASVAQAIYTQLRRTPKVLRRPDALRGPATPPTLTRGLVECLSHLPPARPGPARRAKTPAQQHLIRKSMVSGQAKHPARDCKTSGSVSGCVINFADLAASVEQTSVTMTEV
jgi:hypothetical protein